MHKTNEFKYHLNKKGNYYPNLIAYEFYEPIFIVNNSRGEYLNEIKYAFRN